jgi:hypothetical protein
MNNLLFYKQRFNLINATFLPIEHIDAMVAIVYKVTFTRKVHYILKICPRAEDYWREIYFLDLLSNVLPVAKVL